MAASKNKLKTQKSKINWLATDVNFTLQHTGSTIEHGRIYVKLYVVEHCLTHFDVLTLNVVFERKLSLTRSFYQTETWEIRVNFCTG